MKSRVIFTLLLFILNYTFGISQITLIKDYQCKNSDPIGSYNNITFYEGGFSGLVSIPGTHGNEFWTCSDRGVNVDCANANPSQCRPGYDKLYCFPEYVPKIHRIRVQGDSIQIINSIAIKNHWKRDATGLLNPTGFGSTESEIGIKSVVSDCAEFSKTFVPKDTFGIDAEGIALDANGNFWICEEGGPTVWNINSSGVLIKRFTPYSNQSGAIAGVDFPIDSVFKFRKNNRGFEGMAITPSGKIYTVIQSPILFPSKSIGESSRIHRILEIDPVTGVSKMYAYINDGTIGTAGVNQIRNRDWKIGDMTAVNDTLFLVIEQARRGTSDYRRIYLINIKNASPVTSGLYNSKTLEALIDSSGLIENNIIPVAKTLFIDLNNNSWPYEYEKAEGISIINDSTIAICNDNDYGQFSPNEDGIPTATGYKSHLIIYRLQGKNKLPILKKIKNELNYGVTGIQSSHSPYLIPKGIQTQITSLLTVGDKVNNYSLVGLPDGMGAMDNNDGTFWLLANHEVTAMNGIKRAHGHIGAFISKWTIDKKTLNIMKGEDLIKEVHYWNGASYSISNNSNPVNQGIINRLCAGDLASKSAFAYRDYGTEERIFLSGEEAGSEGRAFAHVLTGLDSGKSFELPFLGKFSWENALARPFPSLKTVVIGLDDSSPGQVYVYIGQKTKNGSTIEKAGLSNGQLYGIQVKNYPFEVNDSVFPLPQDFHLINLGNVSSNSGAEINSKSNSALITNFLRPEDGTWDPLNPNDFYFVTTNSFTGPSRLWRLRFANINNPESGGSIELILKGNEGHKMLDNITMDKYGNILLQEDPGNQEYLCRIWQYNIQTTRMTLLSEADPSRFSNGSLKFQTKDEETSGIIDMEEILGSGNYFINVQSHYSIPGELIEGGQLLLLYNPSTYNASKGNSPNTSQASYIESTLNDVEVKAILTAGDLTNDGYKMVGIPDGTGAFDNQDGTFTFLVNHEIPASGGIIRAHGQKGAFISKLTINKKNMSVLNGEDLIKKVNLWNKNNYVTFDSITSSPNSAFSRFCAADLPYITAFYNFNTDKGTKEKLFMNGEEAGNNGRAFAHIATGINSGITYELPRLGKFSWENSVACPTSSDQTFVIGLDDSSPGQVYCYLGEKQIIGNEIEKAGLTNGILYGLSVENMAFETNQSIPMENTRFSLIPLGDVSNISGDSLNILSNQKSITNFLRPEDGAWDPIHPNDFYFVTTNNFNNPSRLWRCRFYDRSRWELGGTISVMLDGSEGHKMLDNITIDHSGHILLQEDPGNVTHIAKIWLYEISSDKLKLIAQYVPEMFTLNSENFITQDEESSGIIDAQEILGPGNFLLGAQAHYSIPGEIYEGGQLNSLYHSQLALLNPKIIVKGNGSIIQNKDYSSSEDDNTDFGNVPLDAILTKNFEILNNSPNELVITEILIGEDVHKVFSLENLNYPIIIKPNSSLNLKVSFSPNNLATIQSKLIIINSDISNKLFEFSIRGNGILKTNTSEQLADALKITLYPNPANEILNINISTQSSGPVIIQLLNSFGQSVYLYETSITQNEERSHTYEIPTLNLPTGIYTIQVLQSKKLYISSTTVLH